MRRVITFTFLTGITVLFLNFSSVYNFTNCSKFHKGTFYFHPKNEGNLIHFTVIRNDSMQIETNNDNGNITKLKLRWIDDCTYEMKFIGGTDVLSENIMDLKKKMVLKTTILSGTDKYYTFKSTSNLNDRIFSDTIWLAK